MLLQGKSAVITGSTSGIGLGIARALAEQGADILLNGFGPAGGDQRTAKVSRQDIQRPCVIQQRRHVRSAGHYNDGRSGNAGVRSRRHPREQCRHSIHGSCPEVSHGPLGRDHIDQSFSGLSRNQSGIAADAGPQLGPHHQYRVDSRPGGIGRKVGLRCGKARSGRLYQGRRA